MAKPWAEVAASPEFQSLSTDQQEAARDQYFESVVAPNVPKDKLDDVRLAFDRDTKPKGVKKMSWLDRFGTGVKDEAVGALEKLTAMGFGSATDSDPSKLADDVKSGATQREADLRAQGETPSDPLRIAGNMVGNPLNFLPGGGELRAGNALTRMARAGVSGAESSALDPVTGNRSVGAESFKEMGESALSGGAIGAIGEGIAKAITPTFRASVQKLMDAGVRMTPGQMAGGTVKAAEDRMTSIPVTGDAINSGVRRSIQDFNKAAYNRALAPIGEKYEGDEVGREGIAHVEKKISTAYDKLKPQLRFTLDKQFVDDIGGLHTLVSEMPPDQAKQFEAIFKNRVERRLQPTGTMDGETFKQVESEIGAMAANYGASADPVQRQLGTALRQVNEHLRENLERSNPGKLSELKAINSSWAAFTRLQTAAANRATSHGVFTPSDLMTAVKRGDRTVRKGAFARGDALMQDLAEAGQEVLPNKYPDSGTAGRSAVNALAAGGLATLLHSPHAVVAAAASALPYTSAGMNSLRYLATTAPEFRNHLANRVRQAAPYVARPAAQSSVGLLNNP